MRRFLIMALSVAVLVSGQSFATAARAAAAPVAVAPLTCTPSGAWFTEDVAPQVTPEGLLFAGPSHLSVNYYHPLSGNLQGIVDSSMTITKASGYQVAMVWEINRTGTTGYATIVAEPYMNGWVAGQGGTFTVTQATLVWTSKVLSGPGSQSEPISLADMGSLFPGNALLTVGVHLGTDSTVDQSSLVSAVSGCVTEGSQWVSAGTPTITGTPVVDGTLTAAPGTWAPASATFSYQWNTEVGPISGATSSSYTPSASDAGHTLTVTVTGSKDGYAPATNVSAPTAAVSLATMTVGSVTVHGTAAVGSVLTAALSGWVPTGLSVAYVWSTETGPITGATTSTYTPVAADLGHALKVAVTATLAGYTPVTVTSAATAQVTVTPLTCTPSGAWFTEDVAPQVTPGGLLFAGPSHLSVNYYHPLSGNLQGIVDSSMTITKASGYQVAMVWEINRTGTTGYATIVAEPYMNGWVAGQFGTFTVTQKTLVWTSKVASGPGSQSQPISLAEMGSLFPGNALLREGVHLGTDSTTDQSSLVSAVSGCVTEGSQWVSAGTPTITGTPVVGGTLTAVAGTWTPADVALAYEWSTEAGPITGATGASYQPTASDVGHQLTVRITGTANGYAPATALSAASYVVQEGQVSAGTPSITGSPVLGGTLVAEPGSWTPADVALTYQWSTETGPITGATSSTYTPVVGDFGHTLTVTVTGSASGYTSATATSPATTAVAVAPLTCTPSGAWFTEDVAPQVTPGGLLFAGPSHLSVNYYHPLSGNLQGIVDSSMTIASASGYQVAMVWEINRYGTTGYATIVAEPYMNGWVAGQFGTFTVTQKTLVWTSKIASGPGSQSQPISLAEMGSLFPGNALLREGVHLGTDSTTDQSSLVSAVSGCVAESFLGVSGTTPTVTGTPVVGGTLVAVAGSWTPAGVSLAYQWNTEAGAIAGATDSSYSPTPADVGHTVTVTVTGSADGYRPATLTSAATAAVALGSMTVGSVSVDGSALVGSVLTATPSGWLPAGVSFAQQWSTEVGPIAGATSSTYTLAAGDLGHTLTVSVTGTKAGYTPATVVSSATQTVGATPGTFRSVSSSRLLDTRITGPKLSSGDSLSLKVTGVGGVPSTGVSAVVLNVTVTETTTPGFLTVWPTGTTRPVVSNLNWSAGATIPNAVTVKVGTNGSIDLYQSGPGTAQVIVDVAGYYIDGKVVAAGAFTALAPARILDTRNTGGPLGYAETRDLQILGQGGVPETNVSAVVLNTTVTDTTATGFLTVFPSGTTRPTASNLNWVPGLTISNLVTVKVGDNGKVSMFQSGPGTADVVVDVAGYYLGGTATLPGTFVSLSPARVLDTRTTGGPIRGLSDRTVPVLGAGGIPASGVSAVVVNTTVTDTTSAGFLTVYPGTESWPTASNLNWSAANTTIPNLVIVQVGTDGSLKLHNGSGTNAQVVVDTAGYYIGS